MRALPNLCTISKGCAGSLYKVGETSIQQSTAAISGVTDWYARGSRLAQPQTLAPASKVALGTSPVGSLTLAVDFAGTPPPATIIGKFIQKRPDEIAFQQFTYKIGTPSDQLPPPTSLGGISKDISGKNLRFDQSSIDEKRVRIKVNGVPVTEGITLTPNKVKFSSNLPQNTLVDVVVLSEVDAVERNFIFYRNTESTVSTSSSAWGNISSIQVSNPGEQDLTLHVYTSDSITATASLLKMAGVYASNSVTKLDGTALILLSSAPHQNVDRYLELCVPVLSLADEFCIQAEPGAVTNLLVAASLVQDVYPTIIIPQNSYTRDDTFTTDYSIPRDTTQTRMSGQKIIGPV